MNSQFNIVPAERLNSVSEYYFSTKLKEVAEMNARGLNVISLGIGSPDMPPSPETVEALNKSAAEATVHGYQPYVGIPELRKAFADWYQKWFGVTLNAATEVQPLIGSKEGILHISMAFLNPGDGVLVPDPGYPTYSSVSNLVQAKIHTYELDEANGWQPDFDVLEKMDLSSVKLMWVNYPNMPTGANGSLGLFEKLVAFGEIGLSGEIRPVPNGEERLREAATHGFRHAIVPRANAPKILRMGDLTIIPADRLGDALSALAEI